MVEHHSDPDEEIYRTTKHSSTFGLGEAHVDNICASSELLVSLQQAAQPADWKDERNF